MTKFKNAQLLKREHPKTFYAPTYLELRNLKIGDHVKIAANSERFWVKLTSVKNNGDLSGVVDNLLIHDHGFNDGDTIDFHIDNVYNILGAN